jgi:PTS system galactitol-specific IIC component
MHSLLIAIKAIFDTLGPTILLPIVIFVIALILGAKPAKAFRAGATIGIAFVGINLVLGLMFTSLGDVAKAIVTNTGLHRDILDVGWPSAAAIAYGSSVGIWVIPIAIIVNIALLLAKQTRTLNVDVWNFWHFAYVGSLLTAATGSLFDGLIAAAIMAAVALLFADWSAKAVQEFYEVPGVSVPHLASGEILPIAIGVNWLIDRIPGVRSIHMDPGSIQRQIGVFGEPMILGLVIVVVLGIIGYYNAGSPGIVIQKVLTCGINLAAVMVLLPRMVKILMEGLIPVSEAAHEFVRGRAGGQEIYVGLDSAILIGHPATIASSLILVPLAILMSIILPGNRVILFADLAVIPFIVALAAPVCRGNVFRMIVVGVVTLGVGFYIANVLAPLFTSTAHTAGFAIPEHASLITSIVDGFLWVAFVVVEIVRPLGLVGLLIVLLLTIASFWLYRRYHGVWERAAGASSSDEAEPQDMPANMGAAQ